MPSRSPFTEIRRGLCLYFRSGWGWLVPYVMAFAVFRVGHVPVRSGPVTLLAIFWLLHAIHLGGVVLLAQQSLWRWSYRNAWSRALPWLLLGLAYLAPGPYLEFPGDGWEHLRRITSWVNCEFVDQHSEPSKAAYFFIYSLVQLVPEGGQPAILAVYGSGVSLLFSWVNYRLARVLGLGRRLAFVATLVQGLILGNNTFSFLRYYGLSSTPWAHIAVVAVLTLVASWGRPRPPTFRASFAAGAGLLFLIYWSHRQGFALAAVGATVLSIAVLARETRRLVPIAIIGVMAAVLVWLLGPDPVVANLRAQSWLNGWQSVDLFDLASPAFARANQILGLLGWLNILAALLVWKRYPMLAALTAGPLLLLLHPLMGRLLAHGLADTNGAGFMLFHRVLLVIPSGFALVAFVGLAVRRRAESDAAAVTSGLIAATVASLLLATLPGGSPVYNRLWHSTTRVADDLALRNLDGEIRTLAAAPENRSAFLVGSPTALFLWDIRHPQSSALSPLYEHRLYHYPRRRTPVDDLNVAAAYRVNPNAGDILFVRARPSSAYTAGSIAAQLSEHWNPYEVALSTASENPLGEIALSRGATHPTQVEITRSK